MVAVPAPSSMRVSLPAGPWLRAASWRISAAWAGEDAALGAGEVVLGEFGDLLEEVGASLVVEEPGGEVFGLAERPTRASCAMASAMLVGVGVGREGRWWHVGSSGFSMAGGRRA